MNLFKASPSLLCQILLPDWKVGHEKVLAETIRTKTPAKQRKTFNTWSEASRGKEDHLLAIPQTVPKLGCFTTTSPCQSPEQVEEHCQPAFNNTVPEKKLRGQEESTPSNLLLVSFDHHSQFQGLGFFPFFKQMLFTLTAIQRAHGRRKKKIQTALEISCYFATLWENISYMEQSFFLFMFAKLIFFYLVVGSPDSMIT